MTKKKIMMAAMSAGLVAVVGVGGTLAYLSAKTDVVENSFSVGAGFLPGPDGKDGIKLDETKVDPETGDPILEDEEAVRTTANSYENLLPNDSRLKDPTVWLVGGSVDSYVFVKVDGADELAAQGLTITDFNTGDWKKVDGAVNPYEPFDGIYQYVGEAYSDNGVVSVADEESGQYVELSKVFETIHMSENLTQADLEALKDNLDDLTIQAVAVQAKNVTAEEALTEAKNVAEWN